ncbi:MAG: hypothetical protein JRI64_09875, partial [Deltaproteobacteria bacterium]|nr:hypothetical protein [Deltaproteobacteria bacterium]
MAKQSIYFHELGIFGWGEIEPVILSAIIADKSILFIGDHGANKTEACEVISRAILGDSIKFRHYEVPHLNFDDLLGYTNPKKLASGKLEFIETPISIWGAQAALFDEINKVNPFIQGKLHEIIRTKKIMGLETDLQICFSAVNPPVKYQTSFMDLPLASRFCMVPVPSFTDFDNRTQNQILNKGQTNGCLKLRRVVRRAKKHIKEIDSVEIDPIIMKIMKDLKTAKVNFSGRQARDLKGMFVACKTLSGVSNIAFDANTLTAITMSNIPEVNGICRSEAEPQQVYGIIHTVLQGFKFNDPMVLADGIEDLTKMDLKGLDLL